MVKGHSDSEKEDLQPPLHGHNSFQLAATDHLYAHPTDRRVHGLCLPVVEYWLEREIAQWVHHEGSIQRPCSTMELCLTWHETDE